MADDTVLDPVEAERERIASKIEYYGKYVCLEPEQIERLASLIRQPPDGPMLMPACPDEKCCGVMWHFPQGNRHVCHACSAEAQPDEIRYYDVSQDPPLFVGTGADLKKGA